MVTLYLAFFVTSITKVSPLFTSRFGHGNRLLTMMELWVSHSLLGRWIKSQFEFEAYMPSFC
ncbi:hypothetical protein HanIR_Chr03g0118531 [Helianthus annuus]|nr:hypothetical protein HanIR_Chr03g0118531 [Helianthus annuus]